MTTTVLDFEDLHDLEFFDNKYKSKGVILHLSEALTDPVVAHSGKIYVNPYRPEFAPTAYFTAAFMPRRQKRVALWAGVAGPAGSTVYGVFRAYAVNGTELVIDGPRTVQVGRCGTRFEVATPDNQIASVELQMFAFDKDVVAFDPDQAIDDLEFEVDIRIPRAVRTPAELPIYNRWWGIETHWGLTPGGPPGPWDIWLRPFAVALSMANIAHQVSPELRPGIIEIAKKQSRIASDAIAKQAEANNRKR